MACDIAVNVNMTFFLFLKVTMSDLMLLHFSLVLFL